MNQLEKLRGHIERIAPLNDEEWQQIAEAFKLVKLKKHQYLVQPGMDLKNDHWVVKGCLKASFTDIDGKENILQFAVEDWWISDYNAVHKGQRTKIEINCLEPSELLVLHNNARQRLYEEVPVFQTFFLNKISHAFVALNNRILSFLTKNPKEKYEEFLMLYPDLVQRIPKKYIAQYLGVSRETLSRLH